MVHVALGEPHMSVGTAMSASDESAISVICSDGFSLPVNDAALQASKLVESLRLDLAGSSTSLTSLAVPFSRREVESYINQSTLKSLLECVAALKVADFLQDEAVAVAAARKGSTLLARCSRLLKKRKILQPTVEPSSDDISAFLSLETPLAESILHAGGGLLSWMRILPRSCFHLAVAAEVREHSFELTRSNSKYMSAVAGGLKVLSPPLKQLKAVKVAPSALQQVAAPLHQLQSLELEQCPYPDVPASLTSLTRLRLVSAEEQSFAVFGSKLSSLSRLKRLELESLYTPEYEEAFQEHLSHLTALTHLSISFLCMNRLAATALRNALYACTSLAHLSLENDGGCSCVHQGRVGCTCKQCPARVLWALPGLSHLTFLRLSSFFVEPSDGAVVLSKLPQLVHLNTHNMFNWGTRAEHSAQCLVSAIGKMQQLQALNASGLHLSTSKTADMLRALPRTSLTFLDLQGNCLPADTGACIAMLTNLRELSTTGCLLPSDTCGHLSSLVSLSRLSLVGSQLNDHSMVTLLRVVPRSVIDLNLACNDFPLHAIAPLAALTGLQSLAFGWMNCCDDNMAQALAEHIPSLRSLCTLQMLFTWCSICTESRSALVSSIMLLPQLSAAARCACLAALQ